MTATEQYLGTERHYLHCGHCGSVVIDITEPEVGPSFDYQPVDARYVDKAFKLLDAVIVRMGEYLKDPAAETVNIHIEDFRELGRMIIDAGDQMYNFDTGDNVDINKVPSVFEPQLGEYDEYEQGLWHQPDSEDIGTYLDATHAGMAYDYIADHLDMFRNGTPYQPRAFSRETEEKALRSILISLNGGRYNVDKTFHLGQPAPNDWKRSMPARIQTDDRGIILPDMARGVLPVPTNVYPSMFLFGAIDRDGILPGDELSQATELLSEIGNNLTQGKRVTVYVLAEREDN